jgi:SAM-dependent methyltransferase
VFRGSIEHYDRIYSWKDYRQETERLVAALAAHGVKPGGRLLDVACGTGKHLEHLRGRFHVEGLDLDEEFLEIARRRLPGVPFHRGDMVAFDLGRTFDVVTCLFSSIGYAKGLHGLRGAVAAMARHVAPGGWLAVEPWFSPDRLRANVPHMNVVDLPDLKIARMNTTFVEDRVAILEMHHLVGTPRGTEHFVERHELFCATAEEVQRAFTDAGLRAFHDPDGLNGRGLHLGTKPTRRAAATAPTSRA